MRRREKTLMHLASLTVALAITLFAMLLLLPMAEQLQIEAIGPQMQVTEIPTPTSIDNKGDEHSDIDAREIIPFDILLPAVLDSDAEQESPSGQKFLFWVGTHASNKGGWEAPWKPDKTTQLSDATITSESSSSLGNTKVQASIDGSFTLNPETRQAVVNFLWNESFTYPANQGRDSQGTVSAQGAWELGFCSAKEEEFTIAYNNSKEVSCRTLSNCPSLYYPRVTVNGDIRKNLAGSGTLSFPIKRGWNEINTSSGGGGLTGSLPHFSISGTTQFDFELPETTPCAETLDPWPELLNITSGAFIGDAEKLATQGLAVDKAVADGVTKLLVRMPVAEPYPVNMKFCIDGDKVEEDGSLSALDDDERSACVQVQTVGTKKGYYAFAVYHVPEEFNRGDDEELEERVITINAEVETDAQFKLPTEIKLVRPPLILIHGLWSNPSTWNLPLMKDPRWNVCGEPIVVPYATTNASHFIENTDIPFLGISQARHKCRNRGVAVTQVDVIGHSMGGVLARRFTDESLYHSKFHNYGEGFYNRLITLNTPHAGSQLGNLVQWLRGTEVAPAFEFAMDFTGRPVHEGAIEDLAVGSHTIKAMSATEAHAFAFVGAGGSERLPPIGEIGNFGELVNTQIWINIKPKGQPSLWVLKLILNFIDLTAAASKDLDRELNNLYGKDDVHDLIVPGASQGGGLPDRAQTTSYDWDSIHTSVTGTDSPYNHMLLTLLNTAPDEQLFAGFPEPSTINLPLPPFLQNVNTSSLTKRPLMVSTGGVRITSPIDGQVVQAGELIPVTVESDGGTTIDRVLVLATGTMMTDTEAPFESDLYIPEAALGPISIIAIGAEGDVIHTSDPVTVTVTTDSNLTDLRIVPSEALLLGTGTTEQLYVMGVFDDDVERDVSASSTGTLYLSSNPAVVMITPDGMMTATGIGQTTVLISNSELQKEISVSVEEAYYAPLVNSLYLPVIAGGS